MTKKTTTLGILGGGQLGRMSAQAATKLNIKTIILTPEANAPASQVATNTIQADYTDETALKYFAEKCDFITYEFENIPVKTVQYLKTFKSVYPDENLLEVSQDRTTEKTFLNDIGIPTALWHVPKDADDIREKLKQWGDQSCILKTTRFGYDGKGQAKFTPKDDLETLFAEFDGTPIIMEQIIDFKCEISVIVARDHRGTTIHYDPCLNEHKNHILSKTTIPAPLEPKILDQAIAMAQTLAEKVSLRGVLTLELFVIKSNELLANEIAPRTHNSGHWSIDACAHSQFENHVRAVCELDVLKPNRHSNCEMHNLIGNDINNLEKYKTDKNAHIHLYGKSEAREGRKMGHVTVLGEKI